jgi:phosphomannomutase
MGFFFGIDGIRGQVNNDLSQATAYKCGNALAGKNKNAKISTIISYHSSWVKSRGYLKVNTLTI